MRTDTYPTIAISPPPLGTHDRSSRSWLWPGVGIAVVGLVAGLVLGVTSYQDSQREIDKFARMTVPGTMTVQVDEPDRQVVYYEGVEGVGVDEMVVSITDRAGFPVALASYEGELVYETTNLTLGRAIASFDATQMGAYEIEVTGIDTGEITVGESVARLALPGVLGGLAIAGFSLLAGFAIWLYSILKPQQGSRPI
jgi:hypothetical protein